MTTRTVVARIETSECGEFCGEGCFFYTFGSCSRFAGVKYGENGKGGYRGNRSPACKAAELVVDEEIREHVKIVVAKLVLSPATFWKAAVYKTLHDLCKIIEGKETEDDE